MTSESSINTDTSKSVFSTNDKQLFTPHLLGSVSAFDTRSFDYNLSCTGCFGGSHTTEINELKKKLNESEAHKYKANEIIKQQTEKITDSKLEIKFLNDEYSNLKKRNLNLYKENQRLINTDALKQYKKQYKKQFDKELNLKRQKISSINDIFSI
jgi:hypothetical protein